MIGGKLARLLRLPSLSTGETGITGRDWTRTRRSTAPGAGTRRARDTEVTAQDAFEAGGTAATASATKASTTPPSGPPPGSSSSASSGPHRPDKPQRKRERDPGPARSVTEVPGIGQAAARDLAAAGVTNLPALADADLDQLATALSDRPHSRNKLAGWIEKARRELG